MQISTFLKIKKNQLSASLSSILLSFTVKWTSQSKKVHFFFQENGKKTNTSKRSRNRTIITKINQTSGSAQSKKNKTLLISTDKLSWIWIWEFGIWEFILFYNTTSSSFSLAQSYEQEFSRRPSVETKRRRIVNSKEFFLVELQIFYYIYFKLI